LISVNENAAEPPSDEKDSINSASALAMEAAHVNRSFAQQVLLSVSTS
jgi:translation initiation factor 3 subunit D